MVIAENIENEIKLVVAEINTNLPPGQAPVTVEKWIDDTLKLALLDYYSKKITVQKEAEYEEAMSLKHQKDMEARDVIEDKRKQLFAL